MTDELWTGRDPQAAQPRAVGAPLPRGSARRPVHSTGDADSLPEAPGRAVTDPPTPSEADVPSNVQRAASALRAAVPYVQRLLPLLDGNLITAITHVLTPHTRPAQPADLGRIEDRMADLELRQRELRAQIAEQNTSLQRVEDQLALVREDTERNASEQQELMQDLKGIGRKVNVVASIGLVLLLISISLNVFLYLHIEGILR